MDELFERLAETQKNLKLSNSEKEQILNACKAGKAKRKINYKHVIAAAAVLILTVVAVSPGFLLKAGMNDSAASCEEADDILCDEYFDEKSIQENGSVQAQGTSFRFIYYLIPKQFSNLVDSAEFEEWKSTADIGNRMPMAAFVEYFGIEKSDFDTANLAYAKEIVMNFSVSPLILPLDFPEQEKYEVFNSDIVYCGDDAKIAKYYAVSNYPYSTQEEFTVSGNASQSVKFNLENQ